MLQDAPGGAARGEWMLVESCAQENKPFALRLMFM